MVKRFFGLCLVPEQIVPVLLDCRLEITNLCLDKSNGTKAENQLWLTNESGDKMHLLAVISRKEPHIELKLTFAAHEKIYFLVSGDASLHLVGHTAVDFSPLMYNPAMQTNQQNSNEKESSTKQWVELSSGIRIKDIDDGFGCQAKTGDVVTFVYEARLHDNQSTPVTTNMGQDPYKIQLGDKSKCTLTGWHTGIMGMKVGGKRRIDCPPEAAYGKKGVPPIIPPSSSVFFDITLKDITLPSCHTQ